MHIDQQNEKLVQFGVTLVNEFIFYFFTKPRIKELKHLTSGRMQRVQTFFHSIEGEGVSLVPCVNMNSLERQATTCIRNYYLS